MNNKKKNDKYIDDWTDILSIYKNPYVDNSLFEDFYKIESSSEEIDKLEDEKCHLQKEITKMNKKLKSEKNKLSKRDNEIEGYKKEIIDLNNRIESLQKFNRFDILDLDD